MQEILPSKYGVELDLTLKLEICFKIVLILDKMKSNRCNMWEWDKKSELFRDQYYLCTK